MKHHGWIVFAIVGLVLVTGLALMYSGGDLKTAGEAKKFGQQYGSQQLPQPPATTTYAPQLPAPPQVSLEVYNGGLADVNSIAKYSLKGINYVVGVVGQVQPSDAPCAGLEAIEFKVHTDQITDNVVVCEGMGTRIFDGSVIVYSKRSNPIRFVHIR